MRILNEETVNTYILFKKYQRISLLGVLCESASATMEDINFNIVMSRSEMIYNLYEIIFADV